MLLFDVNHIFQSVFSTINSLTIHLISKTCKFQALIKSTVFVIYTKHCVKFMFIKKSWFVFVISILCMSCTLCVFTVFFCDINHVLTFMFFTEHSFVSFYSEICLSFTIRVFTKSRHDDSFIPTKLQKNSPN